MSGERILTKSDASEAYNEGRAARQKSATFHNPHERGTQDARDFYEGWCEQNFVYFVRRG